MRARFVFLLTIMASAQLGAQSRWVNIASPLFEPIWLDTITVVHTGEVHRVWIKYIYPKVRTVPATKDFAGYKYKYSTSLYDVDCLPKVQEFAGPVLRC